MPLVIKNALRNRWFVMGLHVGLWLLLCLILAHLRGNAPDFREASAVATPPQSPVPVAGLDHLFLPEVWPKSLVQTNLLNPFYTLYFVPPPPAPPTTRRIEVTYQGFYQNPEGTKQIGFRLDEAFKIAPIGAQIATELYIADASIHALTLTNLAAQTNIIPLNAKKEMTVPIR